MYLICAFGDETPNALSVYFHDGSSLCHSPKESERSIKVGFFDVILIYIIKRFTELKRFVIIKSHLPKKYCAEDIAY